MVGFGGCQEDARAPQSVFICVHAPFPVLLRRTGLRLKSGIAKSKLPQNFWKSVEPIRPYSGVFSWKKFAIFLRANFSKYRPNPSKNGQKTGQIYPKNHAVFDVFQNGINNSNRLVPGLPQAERGCSVRAAPRQVCWKILCVHPQAGRDNIC